MAGDGRDRCGGASREVCRCSFLCLSPSRSTASSLSRLPALLTHSATQAFHGVLGSDLTEGRLQRHNSQPSLDFHRRLHQPWPPPPAATPAWLPDFSAVPTCTPALGRLASDFSLVPIRRSCLDLHFPAPPYLVILILVLFP